MHISIPFYYLFILEFLVEDLLECETLVESVSLSWMVRTEVWVLLFHLRWGLIHK